MITNAKTKRRKNLLSRQLSMCFKNGQHAKNNVIIISTQAFTCTMYMSIDVNGKKKKESFKPQDPKHLHTLCTTQHLSGLLVVSTLHSVLAVEMLLL